MYAPRYNKTDDEAEILRFLHTHDFATLVTSKGGKMLATHLLFLFDGSSVSNLTLLSHMAKANPQWNDFSNEEVLVIFQGPHSYISPFNYEKEENVPTWNYIAIHVYGKVSIMDDADRKSELLHRLVKHHEKKYYDERFKNLPDTYIQSKMKGIVAFEIRVTRVEERFKLSQDKTPVEKQNIIRSLEGQPDSNAREIADEMKKRYES